MNYYLFAAYSLVWTALFIYMFALHRRQNAVEQKLRKLAGKDVHVSHAGELFRSAKGATMKFAVIGLFVGGLIGFLMRPSAFLVGQLSFGAVLSRGASLQGLDQMLVPVAETSFNYVLVGAILGTLVGIGVTMILKKTKA